MTVLGKIHDDKFVAEATPLCVEDAKRWQRAGTLQCVHRSFESIACGWLKGKGKEDKVLLLLTSIPTSYKHKVTMLFYGKDTVGLEEVTSVMLSSQMPKDPLLRVTRSW